MINRFRNKIYLIFFLKFVIYQTNIIINRFNILKSKNELEEKKQLGKIKVINRFYEIFTTLLFNFRNKVGIYSGHNADKIYQNPHNKILLCSIGKEENLYAKEFVEYYLSIGFDKIIILDNNDFNGEIFNDILKNFIQNKLVEIQDLRGLKQIQIPAFNYCYKKYMYLYDWIAFFDFDEYLFIKNSSNVKKYLYNSRFSKCQQILFNWYIYDDNNLLRYDNRTMITRFTHLKYFPGRTKFIVRGNIENLLIPSSHIATSVNYCNSKGEQIFPNSYIALPQEKNSFAYLKHFYTKTAEEYCHKRRRGYAQTLSKQNQNLSEIEINSFFKYNKKTKEKIKIFEKCQGIK